jgi:hypothetical protein
VYVVLWLNTNVIEELAASVFTMKTEAAYSNIQWYLATELFDVITQNTRILM